MADATQTLRSPYLNLECSPDESTLVAAMPSGREQLLATIATDSATGGRGVTGGGSYVMLMLTQVAYDAIVTKDANTLYIVVG